MYNGERCLSFYSDQNEQSLSEEEQLGGDHLAQSHHTAAGVGLEPATFWLRVNNPQCPKKRPKGELTIRETTRWGKEETISHKKSYNLKKLTNCEQDARLKRNIGQLASGLMFESKTKSHLNYKQDVLQITETNAQCLSSVEVMWLKGGRRR